MMGELYNMEVANASMYDGASALAEAAIMAVNVTGRRKIIIPRTVHPDSRAVTRTYTEPQGIAIEEYATVAEALDHLDDQTAALLVQQPDFLGQLLDLQKLSDAAHAHKALFVVSAYPTAMGLIKPPGDFGADIVVGEGQPLGMTLSFGGPYVGIFTCRNEYIRQLPGRIVGKALDKEGKQGLRQVAEQSYHKAHYAAAEIAGLPGYTLAFDGPFFNEFVVRCQSAEAAQAAQRACRQAGIIGGYSLGEVYDDMADCLLFCCTEMNTREEIDRLVAVLKTV
jgi:glycine dehydrogenase subunit 1